VAIVMTRVRAAISSGTEAFDCMASPAPAGSWQRVCAHGAGWRVGDQI
jgi:hypothetical protein